LLRNTQWVGRQRTSFRQLREGKPSTLSEEKIKKLSDCGFVWCAAFNSITEAGEGTENLQQAHAEVVDTNTDQPEPQLEIDGLADPTDHLGHVQPATSADLGSNPTDEEHMDLTQYVGAQSFDVATAAAVAASAASVGNGEADSPSKLELEAYV
jgi:hypothetical protein